MSLYEQYQKRILDLSAFGIARGERKSDYLCTPKGASVIGWTGVDGVHYCTVKALGETVFAVEPMGEAGRNVFPVAESFGDFLRLLMSVGHEAVIAQAHAWTKEAFDAFVREHPITEEAKAQILYLQREYGLTLMENPYAYLKEIYDRFDFSTVPYKKDYYEHVPKEEILFAKEWKVYFSLHDRKGGERAGTELVLNTRFSWAGYTWHVPCAYICAKGLVLDVFAEADGEKVRAFLMSAEDDDALTEVQRQNRKRENPLAFDFRSSVEVNGVPMREAQSQGNVWVRAHEWYASADMRNILEHYHLDLDGCYLWRRACFPWPTKRKPSLRLLKLFMEQRPFPILGEVFSVRQAGERIGFIHPVSGVRHTLTVREYGRENLNFAALASDGYEHPAHCTVMGYTLEPELSDKAFSVSDVKPSDAPKRRAADANDDFASAMAIIGGADGPAVSVAGVPRSGKPFHVVCSALTFAPQESVAWRMTFRTKTVEGGGFCLWTEDDL